jgi:hypothetical protein
MSEPVYDQREALYEAMRKSAAPPRLAPPGQVFVPVRASGSVVRDNGGDAICMCFTPELAERVAALLNADAARPHD